MKHLSLLFVLSIISLSSLLAQRYESRFLVPVYALKADGLSPDFNQRFILEPGMKFDVVSEDRKITLADSVGPGMEKGMVFTFKVIHILPFDEGKGDQEEAIANNKKLESGPTTDTNMDGLVDERDEVDNSKRTIHFCLASSEFSTTGFLPYNYVSKWPTPKIGTVIFPVKLRFGSSNDSEALINDSLVATNSRPPSFATDVTLGTSLGLSWRLSPIQDRFLTLLLSAGVTSVTLDSASIPGKFSNTQSKSAAFSLATGVMYEFGGGGQIGAVVGWDIIGGETGRYWRYEKKPWLGIGVGIQIFSQTIAENNTMSDNLRNVADLGDHKKAKKKKD